jgi:hypothetical protein
VLCPARGAQSKDVESEGQTLGGVLRVRDEFYRTPLSQKCRIASVHADQRIMTPLIPVTVDKILGSRLSG